MGTLSPTRVASSNDTERKYTKQEEMTTVGALSKDMEALPS